MIKNLINRLKPKKHLTLGQYMATETGAVEQDLIGVVTVFVPNQDRYGKEFKNYDLFLNEIRRGLCKICGGCTSYKAKGGWMNDEDGILIDEDTTVCYSYILNSAKFLLMKDEFYKMLVSFGKRTNQQAVAYTINRRFYYIKIKQ